MSIFKKQALIESFPAYDIFEREAKAYGPTAGFVNITADDILGLKVDHPRGGYYKTYTPGSVVSYALDYNECPMERVAQAKERGHELHWINARATVITAHKRAKENLVAVHIGMRVCFEGLLATIEAAPNGNLKFVPIAK